MVKKYKSYHYFSNWIDNFISPLAGKIVPYVSKISFITPNLITLFSFFLYLLGSFFIIFYPNKLLIITVFFFSYLFDCLDGQLARYLKKTSEIGAFLDTVFDYLKFYFLFLAISLVVYFKNNNFLFIVMGLSAAFLFGFRFYIKYRIMFIQLKKDKNYLEKSLKRENYLFKIIDERIKKNDRSFFGKIINFFDVNRHILRLDEGEIILFSVIGFVLDRLDVFLIIMFVLQVFWSIFRIFQRGYQLVFDQKKLLDPLLK